MACFHKSTKETTVKNWQIFIQVSYDSDSDSLSLSLGQVDDDVDYNGDDVNDD